MRRRFQNTEGRPTSHGELRLQNVYSIGIATTLCPTSATGITTDEVSTPEFPSRLLRSGSRRLNLHQETKRVHVLGCTLTPTGGPVSPSYPFFCGSSPCRQSKQQKEVEIPSRGQGASRPGEAFLMSSPLACQLGLGLPEQFDSVRSTREGSEGSTESVRDSEIECSKGQEQRVRSEEEVRRKTAEMN